MQYTQFQYTTQEQYCTNNAKRAVQTWKDHFIAGLASLSKYVLIANWCGLIPQAVHILNIMCWQSQPYQTIKPYMEQFMLMPCLLLHWKLRSLLIPSQTSVHCRAALQLFLPYLNRCNWHGQVPASCQIMNADRIIAATEKLNNVL